MRASAEAEEATFQQRRLEYQESCREKQMRKQTTAALMEVEAKLKKTRKESRAAEAAAKAKEAVKSFSVDGLGQGKKKGGGEKSQKARLEAMDRVRDIAALSRDQKADWKSFSAAWDEKNLGAHGPNWAQLFAEILQSVLNDLAGGNAAALSDFMQSETLRILGDVPTLRVPGVS